MQSLVYLAVDVFDGVGCCSVVDEDVNGGKYQELMPAGEFESSIPRLAKRKIGWKRVKR